MSNPTKGSVAVLIHSAIATILLVVGGLLYRHYEPLMRGTGQGPIELPMPLSSIPMEVGGWQGQEMTLQATTEAYMRRNFADDYMSRRYINREKRLFADLYVVYCASRPSGILGHKPSVCYPVNGWIKDEGFPKADEIVTTTGRRIPCLIHRMHKPLPDYREVVVLSFYVAKGSLATDEKAFQGLMGRNLNAEGDPTHYVAQIQISAQNESSVLGLGHDILDVVLQHLPNERGEVLAAPDSTVSEDTP